MQILIPLLAAFFHECGHIAAMLAIGIPLKHVKVYPFGVDITHTGRIVSYGKENFCLASGVLLNIILFLALLPFSSNEYAREFAFSNLALAILNALPIKMLDGGRILENLLVSRLDFRGASRICGKVSVFFLFLLWVIGIYLFLYSGYNSTLFLLCLYLFWKTVEGKS